MNVTKTEAIVILQQLKNENNGTKIMQLIDKINRMSNAEWTKFAQNNQLSAEKFRQETDRRITEHSQEFTKLNDLISYGTSGDTLHIHLVPKDAHSLLSKEGFINAEQEMIAALEDIREMFGKDEGLEDIKNVFAVAGILHGPVERIFKRLGFSTKSMRTEEARKDSELAPFYHIYKDKPKVGRAVISRESLESDEWQKSIEARKVELRRELEQLEMKRKATGNKDRDISD